MVLNRILVGVDESIPRTLEVIMILANRFFAIGPRISGIGGYTEPVHGYGSQPICLFLLSVSGRGV